MLTASSVVYTFAHSVTYVTDNILKSLKDIILLSGLDPGVYSADRVSYERALATWLGGQWLTRVVLELYDPRTNALLRRWDIDVVYAWNGDGMFFTDTDQLRYHIAKAGLAPSTARYRILMDTKSGRPDVAGWSSGATYRSTAGMVRQSLGSTVEHSGLGASAAYWRNI
ncbi:MAG: HORMA domain containing protein [Deltaproteobacteria bacterium]|nr:MAG: HORMA domain containing protein [Deltaproteobacteria bacterium]